MWVYKSLHFDSLSAVNGLKKYHTDLKSKGYMSSYLSSTEISDSSLEGYFVLGDLYSWENLSISPILKSITDNSEEMKMQLFDKI